MKNYKNELDVDFIGGDKPLTIEEEKAISEFIKANKAKTRKVNITKHKVRSVKQLVKT